MSSVIRGSLYIYQALIVTFLFYGLIVGGLTQNKKEFLEHKKWLLPEFALVSYVAFILLVTGVIGTSWSFMTSWNWSLTIFPNSWDSLQQSVLNVILFVPFGFLLPLVVKSFRKWYSTVGVGLLFSVLIELSQLFLTGRLAELGDLLYNTLGTLLGFFCFHFLHVTKNQTGQLFGLGSISWGLVLLGVLVGTPMHHITIGDIWLYQLLSHFVHTYSGIHYGELFALLCGFGAWKFSTSHSEDFLAIPAKWCSYYLMSSSVVYFILSLFTIL